MTSQQFEKKTIHFQNVEFKMPDSGQMQFSGYASTFNGLDSYNDTVIKGAFERTLKNRERPVMMLYNHMGSPIGKWLTLEEDEKGLFAEGELTPGHSKANDVYASMKHGTLGGLSIGYYVTDSETRGDGVRVLKDIELIEVSAVDRPADLGATIDDVKAAAIRCENLKQIEALLRDVAGLTKSEALTLVSRVRELARSDSERDLKQAQELRAIFSSVSL